MRRVARSRGVSVLLTGIEYLTFCVPRKARLWSRRNEPNELGVKFTP